MNYSGTCIRSNSSSSICSSIIIYVPIKKISLSLTFPDRRNGQSNLRYEQKRFEKDGTEIKKYSSIQVQYLLPSDFLGVEKLLLY